MARFLGDTFGVLALAGKVLVQHWPVLLALALAAEIARARLIIWAAEVAYDHGEVGYLVLALAPMAVVTAMVLMLRRARRSLPALVDATDERGGVITNVAVVLIPFLVYYASSGFLEDDQDEFINYIKAIILGNILEPEQFVGWRFTAVVVLALAAVIGAIRWLLRRWAFAQRHPTVALPATYLEALWLIGVTIWASGLVKSALAWGQRRRVWVETVDLLHGDFRAGGALAAPARAATDWWLQTWSVVGASLVVPTTALVVGSVVYGIRTNAPPAPRPRHRAGGGAVRAVAGSLVAIPRDAVWSRLSPAFSGLRLIMRVGLVPMLVFCLAYVAVTKILSSWLWVLERRIAGPNDFTKVWIPLNRILGVFNGAVVLTLLMCLVAAALGRIAATLGTAHAPLGARTSRDGASGGEQAEVPGQHGAQENPNRDRLGIGRQQEVRGAVEA